MRIFRTIAPMLVALSVDISYGFGAAVPQPWASVQDRSNPPQTTIRIHVRLVAVEVIVTDAQHAPVRDLKKENFQIFDDGRRQEIQHFTIKASNTPVSQPQSPPPGGVLSFPAPNVMPDMTSVRGSIDPGVNKGACSPEAAAPMVAYVQAMLAERMAKSNDRFSMANLTTQFRYQLGYYPDGDDWDGRYRKIEVKVDRPGLNVVSRQGYFPSDLLPSLEVEEPLARDRIVAAMAEGTDSDDLPFKITTATTTSSNAQKQTKINLQIDPRKVGFKAVDARHVDRLRVAIFYADADGNYLGEEWQTMNLNLQEETYRLMLRSGIPFSTTIPAKAPKQIVRIIVYDVGSDCLGSKFIMTK